MRATAIWALLAVGGLARDLRGPAAARRAVPAPLVTSGVAPFKVKGLNEALSSLSAVAAATPAAVSLQPLVPLSIGPDGLVHDVASPPPRREPVEQPAAAEAPSRVQRAVDRARQASCTSPTTVYEWRNLTTQHKQQWTAAIQCLYNTPARSGLANTVTRWDDLIAIHQQMTPQVHDDGQFLPWHRYYLWIYEQEIRHTCNYTGPLGWWNEPMDAGHFSSAPLFTSQYWGSAPDGNPQCITNAAFGNPTLHIGPGTGDTNHCISRGMNESISAQITQSYINTCWSYNDFNTMSECIYYGVHALGHDAFGNGGTMSDLYSSPGDPTFFIHHHFVNHAWRLWQNMNSARLTQIDGYVTQACENNPSSGCQNTTLSYQLSSFGFYPSVTVSEVMNTEGGFLCYKYDY